VTALGIDCGGSESRWLLLDRDGQLVARGTGPRLSGHIFDPAERDIAMAALGTLCRDIRAAGMTIEAVVAGITGLSEDGPEGRVLADTLAALLEAPIERIAIRDDMWLAYQAAFRPGEGMLVYAGTGSAACHVDADGSIWQAGGHGFVIDDAGSGSWIGQQALRWMMRQSDRTGDLPEGTLAAALCDRIGGRDWETIRSYVYAESRGRVAALSLAVAEAAKADDPVALSILDKAGVALGELGLALIGRIGVRPVALSGRAASLHPAIFDAFDRTLAVPDTRLIAIDPVGAAARLALEGL